MGLSHAIQKTKLLLVEHSYLIDLFLSDRDFCSLSICCPARKKEEPILSCKMSFPATIKKLKNLSKVKYTMYRLVVKRWTMKGLSKERKRFTKPVNINSESI